MYGARFFVQCPGIVSLRPADTCAVLGVRWVVSIPNGYVSPCPSGAPHLFSRAAVTTCTLTICAHLPLMLRSSALASLCHTFRCPRVTVLAAAALASAPCPCKESDPGRVRVLESVLPRTCHVHACHATLIVKNTHSPWCVYRGRSRTAVSDGDGAVISCRAMVDFTVPSLAGGTVTGGKGMPWIFIPLGHDVSSDFEGITSWWNLVRSGRLAVTCIISQRHVDVAQCIATDPCSGPRSPDLAWARGTDTHSWR